MRQATFALSPESGLLHPADLAVAESPVIERRAIHAHNALADGSWVLLYSVAGDLEAGRSLLSGRDDVRAVAAAPTTGDSGLAFVHVEESPTLERFRAIGADIPLVVRLPVECLPDGGVRMTILGPDRAIQAAVDRVPPTVSVRLEAIGGFEGAAAALPDRQRAVLEAAVEHGYYDAPRRCTQRELAEHLAVSHSTVSEHLRKLEARLLPAILGADAGTEGLPPRTGR